MTKCVHLLRKFYENTSNFAKIFCWFKVGICWDKFQNQILKHNNNKNKQRRKIPANNKTPIVNNIYN